MNENNGKKEKEQTLKSNQTSKNNTQTYTFADYNNKDDEDSIQEDNCVK